MNLPGGGAANPLDGELRADAVDVLKELVAWRLAPQRWDRVQESMEALRDAVVTGDGEAVRRAVADLELAGPVRATRIGAAPLVPVPESVRDRANHLVHALTTEPTEDTAGEQGNDPGGTSAGAHTG